MSRTDASSHIPPGALDDVVAIDGVIFLGSAIGLLAMVVASFMLARELGHHPAQ